MIKKSTETFYFGTEELASILTSAIAAETKDMSYIGSEVSFEINNRNEGSFLRVNILKDLANE